MHRNPNLNQPSFPLQTADRLPAYAERFLNPTNLSNKTDILVLRLTPDQAGSVRSLDEFARLSPVYDEDEEPGHDERGAEGWRPRLRRLFRR
jgi:hypothetical protein